MSDWTDKIEEIKHFIRKDEPAAGPPEAIFQAYMDLYGEERERREQLEGKPRPILEESQ